jgi:hypothetical protein
MSEVNLRRFAVAGSGEPSADLIADALRDTLPADEGPFQFLVPATHGGLTRGVQAVVEWGWEHDGGVIAVYDGTPTTDFIADFIDNGADDSIMATDPHLAILSELFLSSPHSALIVLSEDGELDPDTLRLARLCVDGDIPVFDLSQAMLEMGLFELGMEEDDPEPEEEGKPEEGVLTEAPAPEEEEWENEGGLSQEAEEQSALSVPLEDLLRILRSANGLAKAALILAERVQGIIDGRAVPAPHAVRPTRRRARTEWWDEVTGEWKPRGRGRLRHDIPTREVPRD